MTFISQAVKITPAFPKDSKMIFEVHWLHIVLKWISAMVADVLPDIRDDKATKYLQCKISLPAPKACL